jgi:hypothetical protein
MRGGYSPAKGLQNTNPQWVLAPVEEEEESWLADLLISQYFLFG